MPIEMSGKGKIPLGPFSIDVEFRNEVFPPLSEDKETRKKQLAERREYYERKLKEVEDQILHEG